MLFSQIAQDSFIVNAVKDFILSTITHKPLLENSHGADEEKLMHDLQFFLDFDLSILGSSSSGMDGINIKH
jgi:predicted metal-dependent HD superfamily phosphohydrolase